MNKPTATNPRPVSAFGWMILICWTVAATMVILDRLAGEPPTATLDGVAGVLTEIVFTVLLTFVAVCSTRCFWQLLAWVPLIASSFDGAIDLPRAIAEVHPVWFAAELFYVALPVLVWVYRARITEIFDRLRGATGSAS